MFEPSDDERRELEQLAMLSRSVSKDMSKTKRWLIEAAAVLALLIIAGLQAYSLGTGVRGSIITMVGAIGVALAFLLFSKLRRPKKLP